MPMALASTLDAQSHFHQERTSTKNNMATGTAREILELTNSAPGLDERLGVLLAADAGLTQRVLACAAMPGLGRRAGIEEADLLPLFGLRFVQQVVAGLLLEDAGVDATSTAITSAMAAQAVAARIPLPKNEEVFLAAWLNVSPASYFGPDLAAELYTNTSTPY